MKDTLTSPQALPAWARWVYALKPASWPKLLVPTLFGQVLGAVSVGSLRAGPIVWGLAFTGLGLGFIVLLNDWGDSEVDTVKRRMFPDGCSPKTIPDRILSARAVGAAGALFGLGTIMAAVGAQFALGRSWATIFGAGCMALFAAYTLPPIRLNYRGGGELLEMIGVGAALPLYNAYLQAGFLGDQVWPWVAGFAFLSLASGLASGISDEQSDRRGGKRTLASARGNTAARRATEASVLIGVVIWSAGAVFFPTWMPFWAVGPAIAIVIWRFLGLRRTSDQAVTNAFDAQARYKRFLHSAIWHSTTVASLLLWLRMVIG